MKRIAKITLALLIAAVLVGGGGYLLVMRSARSANAALLSQVRHVNATRGPLESVARVVGALQPAQKADVVARVSGIVQELPVREGDSVEAGQLLLALDPSDLELELQKAQASLRAARAQLQELEEGPTAVQIMEARNDVAEAEAELARAQVEAAAARRLGREGALSQQEVEQKEAARAAAERTLRLAREYLAQAQRGATRYDLERARAQVDQAQAEVARAEEYLRRTRVTAPMDGTVLQLDTRLGQPVEAGRVVATLGRTDRLEVVAPVNEMDVPNVRIGQPVRVRVDALGERSFEGAVTAVAPQGNRAQNVATFDVTVALENPDLDLRPGMTATAEIVLERLEDAVQVPLEAVIRKGGQDAVVVAKPGGAVEVTPVTLGLRTDRMAEVQEGLSGGERLVILPAAITPEQYAAMRQAAVGPASEAPTEGAPTEGSPEAGGPAGGAREGGAAQ